MVWVGGGWAEGDDGWVCCQLAIIVRLANVSTLFDSMLGVVDLGF